MTGYLHSIETMGTVDGPGIRTVVFLQGCQLRCAYCHNPDTWAMFGGKSVEAEALVKKLLRFQVYSRYSGGGVTFSGGEPLLQPAFLSHVLRLCKEAGISTCIDTSGVGYGNYEQILRYTDLVLYDVKHYDPEQYRRITGQPMERTLQFIKAVKECGTPLWVRHVVVPGLTEGEDHFRRLRAYAETLPNIQKLELLPYHCLGASKYSALLLPYPLEGCSPMNRTLCEEYEKRFFQNIGGGAHVER